MRELVAVGRLPCRRCGKPHNAYRDSGSHLWRSWASPDDGHKYAPLPVAEFLARYPAVSE